MNRFFRTAFSSTLVYMLMVLIAVVPTGISLPFLSFSCLYLGLLVFMLPVISRKLAGKELLFAVLGAVLALCGFLFLIGRPIVHFVCHGVGLAAVCAFIPLLSSNTKHSDFEAKFRFSIIICAAVVFVIFLAGVTETDFFSINKDNVMRALYDLVPVAIVMLATGVLLLRGLRAQQGSVDEKTFNKRQLRDTLIFSGIVSTVFAIDPVRYINKFLSFMTDNVFSPFYSLLKKGLHELYLLLINRNPPPPGGSGYVEPTPEYVEITPLPTGVEATLDPEKIERNSRDLYRTLLIIFVVVLAAVLLIIIIHELKKLLRKLRNGGLGQGAGYPNEIREDLPRDGSEKKDKKVSRHSRDPRLRMRFAYQEFLAHLRHQRVLLKRSDTCGDINRSARASLHLSDAPLEEFRELYEKARYDLTDEPTNEEARRMKSLLDDIRGSR